MSHTQFACLLTFYVALVALDYLAGSLPIHPDRVRVDIVKQYLSQRSLVFNATYSIISAILIFSFISGLIGLYFLWPPALYLFLAGFIGKIFDTLIIPIQNEKNVFEQFIADLQLLTEGFLIAFIFFGPAHSLFQH